MAELITKVVLAYLLGIAMGGFIVGRLRGGIDLRTQGSGNVGATNALRTQGSAFALLVLLVLTYMFGMALGAEAYSRFRVPVIALYAILCGGGAALLRRRN